MAHDFPPRGNALREGLRIYVPGPREVVSAPAASAPAGAPVGNMGPQYGIQRFARWQAGDAKSKTLVDVTKADALWRLSVFGAVYVSISYGSSKSHAILNLQTPVVITIPGQFLATAVPTNVDAGAQALVTLTQATAGALSQARKFVARTVVNVDLDAGATRYVALTASTLTISGAAVVVPALSTVPLVAGSVLTAGSGFQEFEA